MIQLAGCTVLVLEDEYYLADDAAAALTEAGAAVVGPFAQAASAVAAIRRQPPAAAVIDINLGLGPSFEAASTLRDAGVPFVFLTGYDEDTIPAEFHDIPRLEKPVDVRLVVMAVAALMDPAGVAGGPHI